MRIGIDARLYRRSAAGIGRYSHNIIANLLAIDKHSDYVLFMTKEDKKDFVKEKIKSQNLKIIETPIPHYSLKEQRELAKIISKENCDLVHFLNFNFPINYKGKFITTIHDLTLFYYPQAAKETNFLKRLAFKHIFKKACEKSNKIIAVSNSTKKDIIEKFKIQNSKIKVIYEAADDKILSKNSNLEAKIKQEYSLSGKIILYVGQFRGHKNISGLLKAYKILKKNEDVTCVILGGELKSLKKIVDMDKFLSDNIKSGKILIPGFVNDDELAAWYHLANCFVFPSFYEGFGLPGLEAMSIGLPVVASNTSSLPEIYLNGAIYFNPHDPQEIADKISMVLKDDKFREDLTERAARIVKKYSWKKTAQETLQLYKSIN